MRAAAARVVAAISMVSVCGSAAPARADEVPAADAKVAPDVRELVQRFVDRVEQLPGYQVVMTKQQRIGADLNGPETLLLKHRRSPECRYMKWIKPPHQGREVILCGERYDGKMQVHESGLLGFTTFSIDPGGSMATSGNLRPVAQSGMYNMAKMLRGDVERRREQGEQAEAPKVSERRIDGQDSLCLHSESIAGGDKKAPYPVGAAELCFDRQLAMPTDVQFWHRDGRLMEHYGFSQWQLDVKLTDDDFDTANKAYHF